MNPIITHSLKAPGFNPRTYGVKTWFQSLLSKCNLHRYTEDKLASILSYLDTVEQNNSLHGAAPRAVGLYTFESS